MKHRLISCLVPLVLLMPLSGCPAEPAITLNIGVWLFSVDGNTGFTGVAFLPNGAMEEFDAMNVPPGASGVFTSEVTWQQSGDVVTLTQTLGVGRIYTGTLLNSTYMSGTWMEINGSDSGVFIASKAPLPAIQF